MATTTGTHNTEIFGYGVNNPHEVGPLQCICYFEIYVHEVCRNSRLLMRLNHYSFMFYANLGSQTAQISSLGIAFLRPLIEFQVCKITPHTTNNSIKIIRMNILLLFYLLKGTEQTKEYLSGKATKQTSKDTMLHQREKLWQKLGELKQEIIKL